MVIQILIKIYFTTAHTMNEFVLKKLNKNNCSSLYLFQKNLRNWKIIFGRLMNLKI